MLHEPACLIDFSFYDYHHAGSQAFVVGFGQIGEVDSDRDSLAYFHEVTGRIVGRNERVFGTGGSRDGRDASLELMSVKSIYRNGYLLAYIQVFDLGLLVVGNHPLLGVGYDVGESLSGRNILPVLDGTASEFAVARSHDYGVGEVEAGHLECGAGSFDSSLGALAAGRYLVHARYGSLLLAYQSGQFFLGSLVFGLDLLQLYRCCGIAFKQVLVAGAVFLEFGQAYLNLGNR